VRPLSLRQQRRAVAAKHRTSGVNAHQLHEYEPSGLNERSSFADGHDAAIDDGLAVSADKLVAAGAAIGGGLVHHGRVQGKYNHDDTRE